ncbi:MAG TPA: hypothetical protein ENK23_07835 [Sorangium sp.]|nr:hypothetical protein [Sorangium sp.]
MRNLTAAACLSALLFMSVGSVVTSAAADGAALAEATDVQKQGAQIRYVEGMQAFQARNFEAARKNFNESFETVASPNSLLMVVRSLVLLDRKVEAYEQANKTARLATAAAKTAPKYLKTAAAARSQAAKLRRQLGFVSLLGVESAPPGAKLLVAGREIPRARWGAPIAVNPGTVSIDLNGRTLSTTEVARGNTETVDIRAAILSMAAGDDDDDDDAADGRPRVGTYRGPDRLLIGAVAGGIGVVGFIATAAFGSLAQDKFDELDGQCPARMCPSAALADEADTGRSYQTVANTGLVVGIVGAVAGLSLVSWHLIEPPADDDAPPDDALARLRPTLRVGPTGVVLQGAF